MEEMKNREDTTAENTFASPQERSGDRFEEREISISDRRDDLARSGGVSGHEDPLNEAEENLPREESEIDLESYGKTANAVNDDRNKFRRHPQQVYKNKKVLIMRGKDKPYTEQIKKLLEYGELTAVEFDENPSASTLVLDRAIEDMRECNAAIICIDAEDKLVDQEANEHTIFNQKTLVEIGAAMALYERSFILLLKEDVSLPAYLDDVYTVRYTGENLDGEAIMRFLEAINDIKKHWDLFVYPLAHL